MPGETTLTVVGDISDDPTLTVGATGLAGCRLFMTGVERYYDHINDEWLESEPQLLRCTIWGRHAENVAASLTRGTQVFVHGRITHRSLDSVSDGIRFITEVDVDEIGPSLREATATVSTTTRDTPGPQAASTTRPDIPGAPTEQ